MWIRFSAPLGAVTIALMAAMAVSMAAAHDPAVSAPRRVPLGKQAALEAFEVHPDFQVQLVAAEPNVIDPVSLAFDSAGRMWVVEMRDYPTATGDQRRGRIQVLQDRDKDGFFESANTFADDLDFPTGLAHFRNGVIVTLAGEVVFLADSDGDLICDRRETWFTGFSQGNEQLRANHPTWTLENRIHVASGLRGGEVSAVPERWRNASSPLSLSQRDFDFSPIDGSHRAVAGNSQFGFHQDEAGQAFVCSNRNPCQLLMADAQQVTTNPLLPLSAWSVDVMPAAADSQVFPLVDAWTTSNLHAGQFTAACGVFRYESDRLNHLIGNDFFACEPTGSLVQRYRTISSGVVPETERGRPGVEFLASRDPWFRPVDLVDGPEGALYVVDMHRAVIEHPEWVPDELKQREDQRWGDDAGRIYRLVAAATDSPLTDEDLSQATIPALAAALSDTNRWRRTTAARLLFESATDSRDPRKHEVADAVRDQLQNESAGTTPHAARIVWLLHSIDDLREEDLRIAVHHPDPTVRRQGVRLLALHRSRIAHAGDWLERLAGDQDPRVRYQMIMELASVATPDDVGHLVAAAKTYASDSEQDRIWIANATGLVADTGATPFLQQSLTSGRPEPFDAEPTRFEPLVRRLGWSNHLESLAVLLEFGSDPLARPLLDAYVEGMHKGGRKFDRSSPVLHAGQLEAWDRLLVAARRDAVDESLASATRLSALHWLAADDTDASTQARRQLIETSDPRVMSLAVDTFRRSTDPAIGEALVRQLPHLGPGTAGPTLALLIENTHWTAPLLDAIEAGDIPRGWLDPTSQDRLRRHPDAGVRDRAVRVLAGNVNQDRAQVLATYSQALATDADPVAGQQVFRQHCSTCHRIDGVGSVVGPDISDLRTQSREQILSAILDPNSAIDANYFRYSMLTTDGQIIEGLLQDRTAEFTTLTLQNGVQRTIPANSIDTVKAAGVSLMPEGFEQQISPEGMRDLIDYLKEWRFLNGAIPGA